EASRYCYSSYTGFGEYCYPDNYQESYCCGYSDDQCCYYTNVAALWWFWVLLVLLIVFFAIMITVICRRRRLRQGRTGYVVVRGQNYMPGTVVTQNNAHIAQVEPPGTVYAPYYGAAPPYQGYQDPRLGGESAYGCPPPYAPPAQKD
ncbi:Hypothetical predicted protein, partial [Paramuricea clavata]